MLLSEFIESEHATNPFAAVLGYPVSQSRSPGMHNASLAYHGIPVKYHALACPPSEFDLLHRLFSSPGFRGANVTIPLKEKIAPVLNDLDETARRIGAVNTVVINPRNRRLTGFNTDAYGFMKPLEPFPLIQTAVILGTGGAARAAVHALVEHGCQTIYLVSRRSGPHELSARHPDTIHTVTYDRLDDAIRRSELIVNTTPVGMYPDTDRSPVPEDMLPLFNNKICYDIIYNPPETRLLEQAARHGARVIGGLEMFLHQAARSFELWFGKSMPMNLARSVVLKSLNEQGE